jgi:RNA polymerase sigma factor (sigma-70 family)
MLKGQEIDLPKHIIEGCVNGDRRSQEALYKKCFGFGMSICLRHCKTKEEALEVLNDGFLKIFNKIHLYNSHLSFKNWAKKILVNTSIDHYRKESKHYHNQDIDSVYDGYIEQESPIEKLQYQDLIELIQKLPAAYRITFNLYVIDGYTHEQIANKLKISIGTSKSNVSRAREMIKGWLINNKKTDKKSIL